MTHPWGLLASLIGLIAVGVATLFVLQNQPGQPEPSGLWVGFLIGIPIGLWIAPRAGATPLVAVLLSNRLHPRYADSPIQDWRRAFHDAAAAACAGLRA